MSVLGSRVQLASSFTLYKSSADPRSRVVRRGCLWSAERRRARALASPAARQAPAAPSVSAARMLCRGCEVCVTVLPRTG
eukprot:2147089-Rhodomonas_salina.2